MGKLMKFWRIVAGNPEIKSLILGEWLRLNYISVGYERLHDADRSQRQLFTNMEKGDKVVVVTDGCIWAVGEIAGKPYEKDEPPAYKNRKNVVWYKITRVRYDGLPEKLQNKLTNQPSIRRLSNDEWQTIVLHIT